MVIVTIDHDACVGVDEGDGGCAAGVSGCGPAAQEGASRERRPETLTRAEGRTSLISQLLSSLLVAVAAAGPLCVLC